MRFRFTFYLGCRSYVCARELLPGLDRGAGEGALPHAVEEEAAPALLAGCMDHNYRLAYQSLTEVEVDVGSGRSMEGPKRLQKW